MLANYANLGERYLHIGRLKDGKDILQKGIDLNNDNFLCFTNMAAYWIQVRDIGKGIYFTEKSIELGNKQSSWWIVHAMREQLIRLLAHEKELNKNLYFPDVVTK